MRICRVIGNLVSTCKIPDHEGFKILAVRAVDLHGRMHGETFQAIDCAQAGVGDFVLVIEEGGSCSQVMSGVKSLTPKGDRVAVNKSILAVVDYIEADGELRRLEQTAEMEEDGGKKKLRSTKVKRKTSKATGKKGKEKKSEKTSGKNSRKPAKTLATKKGKGGKKKKG